MSLCLAVVLASSSLSAAGMYTSMNMNTFTPDEKQTADFAERVHVATRCKPAAEAMAIGTRMAPPGYAILARPVSKNDDYVMDDAIADELDRLPAYVLFGTRNDRVVAVWVKKRGWSVGDSVMSAFERTPCAK